MWFSKESKVNTNWVKLDNEAQFDELINKSDALPILIFKHSTRCSISSMAKRRLEDNWSFAENEILPIYLDLLAYRTISNKIAADFGITHESPQVLLIKNGKCVYHASHSGITVENIKTIL